MPEFIIDIPQYVNMTYEPSTSTNNLEVEAREIIVEEQQSKKKMNFVSSDGTKYALTPNDCGYALLPAQHVSYAVDRRRVKKK